jgi:hypothetical protein
MKTVMVMIFLAALTLAGADIRIKTVEKEFQRKERNSVPENRSAR